MATPHPPSDATPPPARLPRPSWASASTQMTNVLDARPTAAHTTISNHQRIGDAALCDTSETQELLDNFFGLYASPQQADEHGAAPPPLRTSQRLAISAEHLDEDGVSLKAGDKERNTVHTRGVEDLLDEALLGSQGNLLGSSASAEERDSNGEEENEENDEEDLLPMGRLDGHHAQQSQYVSPDGEEEDEEQEQVGEDGSEVMEAAPDVDDGAAKKAADATADHADVAMASTTVFHPMPEESGGGGGGGANVAPSLLTETPTTCSPAVPLVTSVAPSTSAQTFWPFAHPPAPSALPHPTQTRAAFHTQRYGAFIKAYLGLSDHEVRQAERRGRGICMIGVHRVTKYGKGTTSSSPSFSFASPRVMPRCPGIPAAFPNHPFRLVRQHVPDPVRTQRVFLRHSVLAVEGDAVFCHLIDRAEALYAVEQQRLDAAVAHHHDVAESDNQKRSDASNNPTSSSSPSLSSPVMHPRFRKLPRVVEPYLQPNARCIALHYGLPKSASAAENSGVAAATAAARTAINGEGEADTSIDPAAGTPFPRATLIAVVSTTRLEENAEIYVSMDSYYRCLDEVAWYRRCYQHLNARYGCSEQLSTADATAPPPPLSSDEATASTPGDVYSGVKRFLAWPAELTYYHGVGRRHASNTAEGAFPFTLVDLGAAPELGEGQKGVVASLWVPYGTCLLYCGPSVATRKVEKLVSARVLSGDAPVMADEDASGDAAAPQGGQWNAVEEEEKQADEKEEEDLSFATDDTYALGLGRHGVCFGQGLTRYINHRYNTSRFGNVELCSVMLSVPSEFGIEAKTRKGGRSAAPLPPTGPAPDRTTDGSLTDEEKHQICTTVKKQLGRGSGSSAADGSAAFVSAPQTRGKRKQPPARRVPRFFLEEKSYFVTVPFFLVTTDIPPGASLLAWTYGEDYDAKLERQAVAAGHLVPYIDAALLNRRLAVQPVTRPMFQRYSGDYRFAVGAGDVVWRRRPLLSSSRCCVRVEDALPMPEEDLFVVVQAQRMSVEQVLLQSLARLNLTEEDLGALLREQNLIQYVSPHAPVDSVTTAAHNGAAVRGGARRRGRGGRGSHRGAATTKERAPMWSLHWAVFELPANVMATGAASLPLARAEDALRRCVVATVESVGLLQPDIDYSVMHTQHGDGKGGGGRGRGRGGGRGGRKSGGGTSRPAADSVRRIIVNLDDLHHVTRLVRSSSDRATAVPPLLNGLLWPLFSSQLERSGSPTAAGAATGGSRVSFR